MESVMNKIKLSCNRIFSMQAEISNIVIENTDISTVVQSKHTCIVGYNGKL